MNYKLPTIGCFLLIMFVMYAGAFSYYAPIESDNKLIILGESGDAKCGLSECEYRYTITNNDSKSHTINIFSYLDSDVKNGTLIIEEINLKLVNYEYSECLEWVTYEDTNKENNKKCNKEKITTGQYYKEEKVNTLNKNGLIGTTAPLIVKTEKYDGTVSQKGVNTTTINKGETKTYKIKFQPTNKSGELIIKAISDTDQLIKASLDPTFILTDLNHYYDLDEVAGVTANDKVSNDFTMQHATYWDTNGKHGGNIRLHVAGGEWGQSDYIYPTTGTISVWVKPLWTGGFRNILSDYVAATKGTQFGINDDNTVIFYYHGATPINITTTATVDGNKWNLIQVVWGATDANLHINGVKAQTDADTYALTLADNTIYLGKQPAGNLYEGWIDEVAMWDVALSEADLNNLWNDGNGLFYGSANTIDTNYSYTISKETASIIMTNTTTDTNITVSDYNWFINSIKVSDDENYTKTGATERTDYNICLWAGGIGTDTLWHSDYECKNVNTGKWYGDTNFYFFDEETGLGTSATIDFNGTQYTGTNFYLPTTQITDSNTNTTITFTITKATYATRYYTIDMNKYTDLNIGFATLTDTNSTSIPLKVYQTDDTTLYPNTYVELYKASNGLIVGRQKTNSNAEATFNLHSTDQNYYASINNGQYTYYPVMLTIFYPKNELTLTQISEKWRIDITQNLYVSYTELDTNKIIYLLPNTALPFNIQIQDMNGNYFARTYAKQYPGNPTSDTLQPYLVDVTEGVLTTLRTVSGYTNSPIGDVSIKVYKLIPAIGRTYVEEVLTDSKGEALTMLVTNADYEFEVYRNSVYIATYTIKATSAVIYIQINDVDWVKPVLGSDAIAITNTPLNGVLFSSDNNIVINVYFTDSGGTIDVQYLHFYLINTDVNGVDGNDVTLVHTVITYADQNTISYGFPVNSSLRTVSGIHYDNNGYFKIVVDIVTSDGNYQTTIMYKPAGEFEPLYYVGPGARTFFGCSTGVDIFGYPLVCPTMLLMALFISLIITIGLAIEMGTTNMSALGAIFLLIVAIFTYLTWVPIVLFALMVVMTAVVAFATRGRFT